MNKTYKIVLIVIGALLVLNGLINLVDDGRLLTYDITSILSGAGFLILSLLKK